MSINRIIAWTDGSCDNNLKHKHGACGGYGVVMRIYEDDGSVNELQYIGGQYTGTTSSRMEIRGVLSVLKKAQTGFHVTVNCDNRHVVDAIQKEYIYTWEQDNWYDYKKFSKRTNADLWKQVLEEHKRLGGRQQVKILWVKGHNNNERNEFADKLARQGRWRDVKKVDI